MSASVVDPRLQNWFINSSYDNNDQSTYTTTYTQSSPSNPLCHSLINPTNPDTNTQNPNPNPNSSILSPSNINSINTPPKPTSQLFGTSIFGDNNYSPLVPPRGPNKYVGTPPLTHNSSTPTPPLPNIHLNNNNNNVIINDAPDNNYIQIKHLITTLSYAIQEMNQFIDTQQNNQLFKALNAKTTNCRNEMVSTLSYYQTYIESNNTTHNTIPNENNCSKSPIHQHTTQSTYCPLNQGLEFPRMAYGNTPNTATTSKSSLTSVSDAKLIALDVVGHIIGTPGPISDEHMTRIHTNNVQDDNIDNISHTPSHPSPIPLSPLNNYNNIANSHTKDNIKHNKSKLNAYAQPYESPYNNNQIIHRHINNNNLLNITPTQTNTNTFYNITTPQPQPQPPPNQHTIQQYYNTLAAQQRAAKQNKINHIYVTPQQTQTQMQSQIQSQNRIDDEIKEKEVLTDNDSMAKSNSIDSNNNNDKEDQSQDNITHPDDCDISINKKNTSKNIQNKKMMKCNNKPIQHKVNKPPLWSAIAKQIVKPTPIISHEEKLPEENNNRNRFSNNNYWNTRNRNNNINNYNGSISSSSTTSNKSDNNNNNNNNRSNQSIITPSPSPPTHNNNTYKINRRNINTNNNNNVINNRERCRVFVSNLPPNVTDEDIRNAFSHCGEIANTVWFPSRTDGKFYGSGLITFGDADGSREALRMNQQNVLGRIIRCEYSSCQDPVKVKPPGCRTIYLNNVPRDAQESRIREVFKHCGKIKRVRFHERDTKRTGGAFVEFENTASCDKALDLHGKIVDNHPLYVDYQRY